MFGFGKFDEKRLSCSEKKKKKDFSSKNIFRVKDKLIRKQGASQSSDGRARPCGDVTSEDDCNVNAF